MYFKVKSWSPIIGNELAAEITQKKFYVIISYQVNE